MSRREHARVLEDLDLAALEASVNRILEEVVQPHLPRGSVDVAVDLNPLPYHGQPFMDPDELSQGEAREGTTWFHRYATLYVVARRRRYTLAVRFVRGSEKATEALKPLLREAMARGLKPRNVYADKPFCTSKPWGGPWTAWTPSSSPCP
jgi:putative transposase